MLTLKLITEQTDLVIKGLEKKHFKGAKEAIAEVIATDKKRRKGYRKLNGHRQQFTELTIKEVIA